MPEPSWNVLRTWTTAVIAAVTSAVLGCGGGNDLVTNAVDDFVDEFEDDFNDPDPDTGDRTPASLEGLTVDTVDEENIAVEFQFFGSGQFVFTSMDPNGGEFSGSGSGTYTYTESTNVAATLEYTITSGDFVGTISVTELVFDTTTTGRFLAQTTYSDSTTETDQGTFTVR